MTSNFYDIKINFYPRVKCSDSKKPKAIDFKTTGINAFVQFNKQPRIPFYGVAKIQPAYWDAKKSAPKQTSDYDYRRVERDIENAEMIIKAVFEDYTRKYNDYPEDLKAFKESVNARLSGRPDPHFQPVIEKAKIECLIEYFDFYIKETKAKRRSYTKNGKTQYFSDSMRLRYGTTKNKLREFCNTKGWASLPFDKVDMNFYYDFQKYYYDTGMSTNYFGATIKNVKKFMKEAEKDGLHNNRIYLDDQFAKPNEEVDNVYLDIAKLQVLEKLNLSETPYLDNARDLFLLASWTGLRFGDVSRLTQENIADGYIDIVTRKTGKEVAIPIAPVVQRIIEKGLPHKISDVNLNIYIKDICKIAGEVDKSFLETVYLKKSIAGDVIEIGKPFYKWVATHSARRSFASNMIQLGEPEFDIMEITGHNTLSAFRRYVKIKARDKVKNTAKRWKSLLNTLEKVEDVNNGK